MVCSRTQGIVSASVCGSLVDVKYLLSYIIKKITPLRGSGWAWALSSFSGRPWRRGEKGMGSGGCWSQRRRGVWPALVFLSYSCPSRHGGLGMLAESPRWAVRTPLFSWRRCRCCSVVAPFSSLAGRGGERSREGFSRFSAGGGLPHRAAVARALLFAWRPLRRALPIRLPPPARGCAVSLMVGRSSSSAPTLRRFLHLSSSCFGAGSRLPRALPRRQVIAVKHPRSFEDLSASR
jgi:hypothetical protein